MSCAVGARLFALGDRLLWPQSAGRRELLEHVRGCPACRRRALAVDPGLALRGRPAPRLSPAELGELRRGLQRQIRLAAVGGESRHGRPRWRAAAFALAAGAVVLAGLPAPPAGPAPVRELAAERRAVELPEVEPLNLPRARVYGLADGSLPVVMIIDESFDL